MEYLWSIPIALTNSELLLTTKQKQKEIPGDQFKGNLKQVKWIGIFLKTYETFLK